MVTSGMKHEDPLLCEVGRVRMVGAGLVTVMGGQLPLCRMWGQLPAVALLYIGFPSHSQ